jgi:Phage derived protein Gp49-like (DUF891)
LDKQHKGNKNAEKTFVNLLNAVEAFGTSLTMPYNKNLGDGLFELRDRTHGKRYYYTETRYTSDNHRIILLLGACGDKDDQEIDIERARKRLGKISDKNICSLRRKK